MSDSAQEAMKPRVTWQSTHQLKPQLACLQVCLLSGVELGRVLLEIRARRQRRDGDGGRQEHALVCLFLVGAGAVGFLVCQDRWIRGPLRGTLSVRGSTRPFANSRPC